MILQTMLQYYNIYKNDTSRIDRKANLIDK